MWCDIVLWADNLETTHVSDDQMMTLLYIALCGAPDGSLRCIIDTARLDKQG